MEANVVEDLESQKSDVQESSGDDSDFWDELQEKIDIASQRRPAVGTVPFAKLIQMSWQNDQMERSGQRSPTRSPIRLPSQSFMEPGSPSMKQCDWEAKIEKMRQGNREEIKNQLVLVEKRMKKEASEQLTKQANEFKDKIEKLSKSNSNYRDMLFKRDWQIRVLSVQVSQQEDLISTHRISQVQSRNQLTVRRQARRETRHGVTHVGRLFEEIDTQKHTIETLKNVCDITQENQTRQSDTINYLRSEIAALEAKYEESLDQKCKAIQDRLEQSQEDNQSLRFDMAELKDNFEKEIKIRDELARRDTQALDKTKAQLKLAQDLMNHPRIAAKITDKVENRRKKAFDHARVKTAIGRWERSSAMSRQERVSPPESRSGQTSGRINRSEHASPRIGSALESSNWRREFNKSEIPTSPPDSMRETWLEGRLNFKIGTRIWPKFPYKSKSRNQSPLHL